MKQPSTAAPTQNKTVMMTETAVMIALGTVLSILKLIDLPYGGSVTVAHMVPVILIAYRYGPKWGLFSGLTYGVLQALLGMKSLSYATSIWAGIAIVVLDYLAAYLFLGAGAWFRKLKSQPAAVTLGALCACVLRYVCHVITGATVWAGLSIPTSAALSFSLIYNATYMIPETIVTVAAAYYLSSVLNFHGAHLTARHKGERKPGFGLRVVAGFVAVATFVYDVTAIFSHLQDAESGTFSAAGFTDVPWNMVGAVSLAGLVICGILWRISFTERINNSKNNNE